jgi:hypothetical protein
LNPLAIAWVKVERPKEPGRSEAPTMAIERGSSRGRSQAGEAATGVKGGDPSDTGPAGGKSRGAT